MYEIKKKNHYASSFEHIATGYTAGTLSCNLMADVEKKHVFVARDQYVWVIPLKLNLGLNSDEDL